MNIPELAVKVVPRRFIGRPALRLLIAYTATFRHCPSTAFVNRFVRLFFRAEVQR